MKRIGFCLLVLLLQRSIAYAQGDLLAYEGFDYPEDVQLLEGCEGGFGFQGPWQKGGFNAIQSKHVSLTDGTRINRGVITNGRAAVAKSVNSIGGLLRSFSHPIGQPDSRVYVSFLVEPGPNLGSGAFGGFYGLTLSSKSADQLHIGGGAKGIGMGNRGGTKTIRTKTVPKSGETLLVVLRAEFKQGNDTFSLFINPSPGAAEPPSEFVKSDLDTGEVNGLVIYSTGSVIIDEIRVGKTFESVTPVSDKPTLDIPSEATPSGDKAASMSQGESKPRSKAAASTNSGPRRQSLDAAELDLHGTKVIIPFNSKQYLRMSNAQPKVFQTMVVEPIKPSEVVEAFYPIDLTRARSSEWVLIVNESKDQSWDKAMYDRFCTEMSGSGFKNNAHKQLKEIQKSGGDLSEFQKSLHGTIDQQEDWRTNITFGQEMGNGNRVFLTLLSFLHVQDKCITASSRHFVTTDEEVRAALAERKEFCRDVHNANQSLAPERK